MDLGAPALVVVWSELDRPDVWSCSALAGRDELADQLDRPRTSADRDLVAAAWRCWGRAAPSALSGPFALAVADPDRRLLMLARDHVGQLPLYYARVPGGVAVSTDLEAVLAHPRVDAEVDMEAAALMYARAAGALLRRTPFRGIGKVAPGTVLTIGAATHREFCYWDPARVPPEPGGSVAEWAGRMREVLQEAVADALPAAGWIGAHVSGGLDSTGVAVLAERALAARGRRLDGVWSWSPPPDGQALAPQDERRLVQRTAAGMGWAVRYVPDDPGLAAALAAEDPLVRPLDGWVREAWVARDAASRGIGVLLTGLGGDEAASYDGGTVVPWLAGRGRLLPALHELRERAALLGDRLGPAGLARDLLLPAVPAAARRVARRVWPRRGAVTDLDVRHRVWGQHSAAVADALGEAADRLEEARTPRAYSAALLAGGTLAARCESWTAAGGRAGVGYRHPLLDRRLLELALAAPPECFRSGGWDRACFRMALEPFLPVEVAWNPRKAQGAVTALALETLTVAAGRGTHARNVELAELESLRREADLSMFALVRARSGV